jgi:HEAT repeat protein
LCEALLDVNAKVRLAASEALDTVNPTIRRLVVPVLVDKNLGNRLECILKIGRLGAEGKPALPVLLHFRQQHGGAPVVQALAAIAPDEEAVTKRFADWLVRDRDEAVRAAVAGALPHMAGGKRYVRTLMHAAQVDLVDPVRVAAVKALGELGPDAKEAMKLLKAAKTDACAAVREAAEQALERIRKDD